MAKRSSKRSSNLSDVFVLPEGDYTWVLCSFKNDEEMRFKVGPFGPEEQIERRYLMDDGEWSSWERV